MAEQQAYTQPRPTGADYRLARVLQDIHVDTGPPVADGYARLALIPVATHLHPVRAGIGGIVQQVLQRLAEGGIELDSGRVPGGLHLDIAHHARPPHRPTLDRLGDEGIQGQRPGLLYRGQLRGAGEALQGGFALGQLLLEQSAVLPGLAGELLILQHFIHQHSHGCQRGAQLMGGAGRQAGHRHDLVIAQPVLAPGHGPRLLLAQHRGHADHEIGDQAGAEEEVEPHAQDVHLGAIPVSHLGVGSEQGEGLVVVQQQAVGQQRGPGHQPGMAPGQHRGGDHQRHDIVGDKGVVGAAREVHEHGPAQYVHQQLGQKLVVGDRPGPGAAPQADRRQGRQHRQADGHAPQALGGAAGVEDIGQHPGLPQQGYAAYEQQAAQVVQRGVVGRSACVGWRVHRRIIRNRLARGRFKIPGMRRPRHCATPGKGV